MDGKRDLKSMNMDELDDFFHALGAPSYKAKQVFAWLHRGVVSFDEMTDQSKAFRAVLEEQAYISCSKIVRKLESRLDGTIKYLLELADGECVETVRMRYAYGDSVCISTQAGCRMGCGFCASTLGGLHRSLAPSEMLDQILTVARDTGSKVSHVVLMGIGEPLDNYENVVKFLHLLSCEGGLHMSLRHVSLSTCGLVDRIYRLMERKLQLTLSVSLHAPNDAIRSSIMPVNRKWGVDALLTACRDYIKATGRRISFEYAMIAGVNDTPACAKELGERLRGMLCHVNLIPANPVKERNYQKSPAKTVERFRRILTGFGLTVTVRRTLGADIQASCGQLRQAAR